MKELSCLLPPLNEYNGAIKGSALLRSPCDKSPALGELPAGVGLVASKLATSSQLSAGLGSRAGRASASRGGRKEVLEVLV